MGELASKRATSIEIRCKSLRFAPTGRGWAAATTEGLLIYSLDDRLMFDPFDLDIDITPKNIRKTLDGGHHLKALIVRDQSLMPHTHTTARTRAAHTPVLFTDGSAFE